MAIKISNTTVIDDSRQLTNITNLKTVGGQSILGTGDIATGGTARVVTISDGTSITINADTTDVAIQNNTQVAGTLVINVPSGTPTNGQKLILRITSSNVQTFFWDPVFTGSTDLALPTTTTGSGKVDYLGFIYNSTSLKWQFVAKNFGF